MLVAFGFGAAFFVARAAFGNEGASLDEAAAVLGAGLLLEDASIFGASSLGGASAPRGILPGTGAFLAPLLLETVSAASCLPELEEGSSPWDVYDM